MRTGAHGNVIKPEYKFDDRLNIDKEINHPPSSLFIALGYNKSKKDQTKHYRRFYPDELEKVKD